MMIKELFDDKQFQLSKGSNFLNSKYKVIGKIGSGTQSSVHAISAIKANKKIIRAIKVESKTVKESQINTEITVIKSVRESCPQQKCFVQIYEYGEEPTFNYLIMTMLGPNLEQLLKLCSGNFTIKTTMILALQLLDRVETIHNQGYIHGDISPQNCLMGIDSKSPYLFLIDFGRCKRFKNKANGEHISYKQNVQCWYNPVFASINAHNNVQMSRRDDIESFLYLMIYVRLGKLPWAKPSQPKRAKVDVNTQELKKRLTPEMLCHRMPLQVIDLLYYTKSIEFYEKPDYDFIRKMLYRCLQRQNFGNNLVYDWNLLEDIDFKVYSGEPKILMKGQGPNNNAIEEQREIESNSDAALNASNRQSQLEQENEDAQLNLSLIAK